jgi:hypothetical protein
MGGATAGGAAAAAAAAARQRRLQQEEEERMAGYDSKDLEGWEFKIVRANTRRFRTAAAVKQLCEEEAKAGWEMVDKFDDQRIRFKRRIEKRAGDQYLTIDPYRTQIGISEGQLVVMIVGIMVVIGLAAWLIAALSR